MSTLMHTQLLCAALEVIVNKALALNLNNGGQLHQLEQKTLTVDLTELSSPISFSVSNNQVLVTTLSEQSDCYIHTSINTLIALKNEQQLTELIKQDKLDINGDIKVAQKFAAIAETVEIDWQSELANHIGDVATYKLTQTGKTISKKIAFTAQQIQADASEWLIHEKKLVVTHGELSTFTQQVTQVTAQVDSLVVRIENLLNNNLKRDVCE